MKIWITAYLILSAACLGLRADINHDGRVDMADLSILASEWLMEEDMSYPNTIVLASSDAVPSYPVGKSLTYYASLPAPSSSLEGYCTDAYPTEPFIIINWDTDHWVLLYRDGVDNWEWKRYDANPIGDYEAGLTTTGTITVTEYTSGETEMAIERASYKEFNPRIVPGVGVMLDMGNTVPPDGTAGYGTGCLFQHTDGGDGSALYVNEGTNLSCNFNAITVA